MNLEDFFTLAELKDGLTSPDRVKELITVLQKEKDCVFKNVGDASTQWDILANIISITKSNDCLDLFIKLDGLLFINKWLKDAHKFGDEIGVHESTIALLRALDKLQINKIRLVCSGILKSVLELLVCDDSVIHEIAKALCDKWMLKEDGQTNTPVASSPSCIDDDEEQLEKPSADKTVDPGTEKVGVGDSGDKDEEVVDLSGGEGNSGIGSGFSKPSIKGEGGGGMAEEVAMEVEREVDSKGGIESSDSRNGKESILIGGSTKLASSEPGTVKDGETALGSVSKAAQESETNTEMFDLNQDGSSEEIEDPMDMVTTRISVISEHGGTSSNSKLRSDNLNFDLNVADDNEDKIDGCSSRNKNPIISSLPSGEESSMEASPRKSMKLDLDLNSLGDGSVDNVVQNQNWHRSPSQSSSSSIMQPPLRNIDLNMNNHSNLPNDAFPNHNHNLFNNPIGMQGRDESGISLFGVIVENVIPQVEPTLELGLGAGSSMGGGYGFPYMFYSPPYRPYMADPRGGVGSQFVGAVEPPPPAFLAGGGSQHNVDLDMNEGNGQVLDENYDHGGQSSWVVGGKRQQPDGGFR